MRITPPEMLMSAADGRWQVIADLLGGAAAGPFDVGLRIALFVTYIAVFAYLLIMLVTRWGDHNATVKSLILSVLLHLSLGMGWATMVLPDADLAQNPQPAKAVPIQQIHLESELPIPESANVPRWEQPAERSDVTVARQERQAVAAESDEPPERRREDVNFAAEVPLDVPVRPDRPEAMPERIAAAEVGPEVAAARPIVIDDPEAEARPEATLPSLTPSRIPRAGESVGSMSSDPVRANRPVQRFAPESNLELKSPDLAVLPDSPMAIPADGDDATIRRRSDAMQADSRLLQPERAASSGSDGDPGAAASGGSPRFTRAPRRAPGAVADGGAISRLTRKTPTAPDALADAGSLVRRGIAGPGTDLDLQPNAVTPEFGGLRERSDGGAPSTYRLRRQESRRATALQNGGTPASEKAVEASLKWLAAHQNPAGFWDADGFSAHCPAGDVCDGPGGGAAVDPQGVDRRGAGSRADAGVTGLAILAFLGAGYTHEEGRYADEVDRAIRWLIRQQRSDGDLAGEATYYARMYCHGIASYALAEALGMQTEDTTNTDLRQAVTNAVRFTLGRQSLSDGGWRYREGQQGDMSMFGWHLMALKSADIAGIPMTREVRGRLVDFLNDRSVGPLKALAAYRKEDRPSATMTAEALFCKQVLGMRRDNPASTGAVAELQKNYPRVAGTNYYYWYYGTLGMFQFGGEPWEQWNGRMRETLVSTQRQQGHAAGSWDPKSTWGGIGGRVYSTALATLCLEVYYRFLPLYQLNDQVTER